MYATMQACKYAGMHVGKYICLQAFAITQNCKYSSVQKCKRIINDYICKYANLQQYKYKGMLVYMYESIHVYLCNA